MLFRSRNGVARHHRLGGGEIECGLERSFCKRIIDASVKIFIVPALEACLKPATPRTVDIAIQPIKPGAEHIAVGAGEVDFVPHV